MTCTIVAGESQETHCIARGQHVNEPKGLVGVTESSASLGNDCNTTGNVICGMQVGASPATQYLSVTQEDIDLAEHGGLRSSRHGDAPATDSVLDMQLRPRRLYGMKTQYNATWNTQHNLTPAGSPGDLPFTGDPELQGNGFSGRSGAHPDQKSSKPQRNKSVIAQTISSDQRTQLKQQRPNKSSAQIPKKTGSGPGEGTLAAPTTSKARKHKKPERRHSRRSRARAGREISQMEASPSGRLDKSTAMATENELHARAMWEKQFPTLGPHLSAKCGTHITSVVQLGGATTADSHRPGWDINFATAAKAPSRHMTAAAHRHDGRHLSTDGLRHEVVLKRGTSSMTPLRTRKTNNSLACNQKQVPPGPSSTGKSVTSGSCNAQSKGKICGGLGVESLVGISNTSPSRDRKGRAAVAVLRKDRARTENSSKSITGNGADCMQVSSDQGFLVNKGEWQSVTSFAVEGMD